MSKDDGNGENSWFKFLEGFQGRPTSSRMSRRDPLLPPIFNSYRIIQICLFSYQCILCMNHILEVRDEFCDCCEHKFCVNCKRRTNCTMDFKPWNNHSLLPEHEMLKKVIMQSIIEEYRSKGLNLNVKELGIVKKRKELEPDDDENMLE